MRITKKVVSIILAIMMVATMMSVMAVSVSATGNVARVDKSGDPKPFETFEEAANYLFANNLQQTTTITLLDDIEGTYYLGQWSGFGIMKNGYNIDVQAASGNNIDITENAYGITGNTSYIAVPAAYPVKMVSSSAAYPYYAIGTNLSTGSYKILGDCSTTALTMGATTTNVTLDLNGKTLTCTSTDYAIMSAYGGSETKHRTLTIKNGTIVSACSDPDYAAIMFGGEYSDIVLDNVKLYSDGAGVAIVADNTSLTLTNGSEIHAGNSFGIATNGLKENDTITIEEGCKVISDSIGIYMPATGELNIAGEVTGSTAVYVKGGTTTIADTAVLTGTGTAAEYTPNGSGANSTGGALVVDSCGYHNNTAPVVNVQGGTFSTTDEDAEAVGSYTESAANPEVTGFISGGTFSGDVPEDYIDTTDKAVIESGGKTYVVEEAATENKVAFIDATYYETLEDAIDAAQAGDTVTLLADINTDTTFTIASDKVVAIDGGAYTVTTTATTLFENSGTLNLNGGSYVALSTIVDNKAGTASLLGGAGLSNTSTSKNDWNPAIHVEGGTVNISNATIISNNACAVLEEGNGIVEMTGGTVQAEWYGFDVVESAVFNFSGGSVTSNQEQNYSAINPVYAVCIDQEATINMSDDAYMSGFNGGLIFNGGNGNISGGTIIVPNGGSYRSIYVTSIDKERYTGGAGGYDVNLNITGGTFTSPKEVLQVGKSYLGTSIVDIEGGTFTSTTNKNNILVSTSGSSPYDVNVSGGSFNYAVPTKYCAEDFYPVSDGSGNYTVDSITTPTVSAITLAENAFGFDASFNNGRLLGVQLKSNVADAEETSESGQEDGSDLRFVAAIETELLKAAEDYGFILAKADATKNNENRTCANTTFANIKYNGTNGEKTLSAKGTYNNISGAVYGDPTDTSTTYKFVTCAVNALESGKKAVARFYVKVNGKVYYMNYVDGSNASYSGCVAGVNNGSIY